MLTCKEVAERASGLLDQELSTWEELKLRLHLMMCRGCARFVEQLRQTDQLAADTAEKEAPACASDLVADEQLPDDLLARLRTKSAAFGDGQALVRAKISQDPDARQDAKTPEDLPTPH